MKRIVLGQTDLRVHPIAMGCWAIGGDRFGAVDDRESIRTIHAALDSGINLFDTAPIYGFGRSEHVLGEALQGRRSRAIIATKLGLRWNKKGRIRRDLSPRSIEEEIHASLVRLRTDAVDLIQIHWPDPDTPIAKTMQALEKAKRAGKVRHIGCSNFDLALLQSAVQCGALATLQPSYHLLHRTVEQEILPYCRRHNLGVLIYEPMAKGILSGKFNMASTFEDKDIRKRYVLFQQDNKAKTLAVVDRIKTIAASCGTSPANLAVAWTLAHPAVHVAITGAKHPWQIQENSRAADLDLSRDTRDAMTDIARETFDEKST